MTGNPLAFSQATNYVCVRDVQPANTSGGNFVSGAWRTRDLNEITKDFGNHATRDSNRITLDSGIYICWISAPAYRTARHKTRLRNVTDGDTVLEGTSEISATTDGTQTRSTIVGVFSIAASKEIEVQHRAQTTFNIYGFGVESNFGVDEIYTVAEFLKIG